jgi:superfamily II DNA or RNA helicase
VRPKSGHIRKPDADFGSSFDSRFLDSAAEPWPDVCFRAPPMRLVFDRGTVLAHDVPKDVPITLLPGLVWDPRVCAHRAEARFHRSIADALVARGVKFTDEVRSKLTRPPPFEVPSLRPYQEAALTAWTTRGRNGIVVMPTGAGKTRVAIAAIATSGESALCIVPTRVLLDQWRRELGALYGGTVGCFGDGEHVLAPITVATFESAYRRMDELGHHFDLLVIDEVHHFGTGLRDEALEMCAASSRLGLTATPPGVPGMLRLESLVGPLVFHLAVGDLAGTFLASFDIVTLRLALTASERNAYERFRGRYQPIVARFMREHPGASWEDFARAAKRTQDGWRAITAWRSARDLLALTEAKREAIARILARHPDAKTLIFTANNESAYAIARELLVAPITCEIGKKERDDLLDRFSKGEIHALVSARVLNEGLDVPDAEIAVIAGASLGQREHVQRVGRLLRPREGKRAIVYDLVTGESGEVGQARRRREGLVARVSAQL